MYSVPEYMRYRGKEWLDNVKDHSAESEEGLRCYAWRQSAMWFRFAHDAEKEFGKLGESRLDVLDADSFVHVSRLERLKA